MFLLCNEHVKQDWFGTSGIFLRKLLETGILTYFVAQNDSKIRPLRSIFNTPLKISPLNLLKKIDGKPVETFFLENDRRPEFWPILRAENEASEAYLQHASKSSQSQWAQHDSKIRPMRSIFNTPLKVSPLNMLKKIDGESVETFLENDRRPEFWRNWEIQNEPKIRPPRPLF